MDLDPGQPLAGDGFVAEAHGADGSCNVTLAASTAAGGILTQQATCCFLFDVQLFLAHDVGYILVDIIILLIRSIYLLIL